MYFRLLGTTELVSALGAEEVASARSRTLLAIFALSESRTLPGEYLIDQLWSGETIKNAKNACHAAISRLRRLLSGLDGPDIETRAAGYRMRVQRREVDILQFTDLCAQARAAIRTDPAVAIELIDRALLLWDDDPLPDTGDCPFLNSHRFHLQELHLSIVELRCDALAQLGLHDEAAGGLLGMWLRYPEREQVTEKLMVALYRQGRATDALGAFNKTRSRLAEDFGLDPGQRLLDLELAILNRQPAELLAC